jgi:hypothetical protein
MYNNVEAPKLCAAVISEIERIFEFKENISDSV